MVTKTEIQITATDRTKRAFASVDQNVNKLNRDFSAIGRKVGTAVGLITASIGFLGKRALDSADEIGKLSTRLGASTQALSEYRHVADLSGVSMEDLSNGLRRMQRNVVDAANGTGEAKEAFEQLGLSAKDLVNLKPEQQFEILADALNGVENESQRVAIAADILGSRQVKLLQITKDGSEGIREMREEARRLGLSLSEDQVRGAEAANDAFEKLFSAFQGGIQQALIPLGAEVGVLAERLAQDIPKAIDFVKENFDTLKVAAIALIAAMTPLLGPVGLVAAGAAGLVALYTNISETERASILLKGAIDDLNKVMSTGVEKADDLGKRTFELTKQQYESAKAALAQAKGLLAVQKASSTTGASFREFGVANVQIKETAEEIEKLELQIDAGAAAIQRYVSELGEADTSSEKAKDTFKGLGEEVKNTGDAVEDSGEKFKTMIERLHGIEERLDPTLKLTRDYKAELEFLDKAAKELNLDLSDLKDQIGKEYKDAVEGAAEGTSVLGEAAQEAKFVITRSFGDIIFEAESLSDALSGIFEAIARSIVDKLSSIAVNGIFEGIFGGGDSKGILDGIVTSIAGSGLKEAAVGVAESIGIIGTASEVAASSAGTLAPALEGAATAAATAGTATTTASTAFAAGSLEMASFTAGTNTLGASLAAAGPYALAAAAAVAVLSGAFSGARSASEIMRDEVRQLNEQIAAGTAEVFNLAEGFKTAGASGSFLITGENLGQLQQFLDGISGINTRLQEVDGTPVLRVLDSMGRDVVELDNLIKGSTSGMTESFSQFSANAQAGADELAGTFVNASDAMLGAGQNAADSIGGAFDNAADVTDAASGRMESSLGSAADAATGKIQSFSSSSSSNINAVEGEANSLSQAIQSIPDKTITITTRYLTEGGGAQPQGFASGGVVNAPQSGAVGTFEFHGRERILSAEQTRQFDRGELPQQGSSDELMKLYRVVRDGNAAQISLLNKLNHNVSRARMA